MEPDPRRTIAARDAALARTGRLTRRAALAATAASLVLMAGFAHLIPTHLPHLSGGDGSGSGGSGSASGGGGGNSGSGTGTGTAAPGSGSGPSQVTSGGS
jgi:hypothetical protein